MGTKPAAAPKTNVQQVIASEIPDEAPEAVEDQNAMLVELLRGLTAELKSTRQMAEDAAARADMAEARAAEQGQAMAALLAGRNAMVPQADQRPPAEDKSHLIPVLSESYPQTYYGPIYTDMKLRVHANGQPLRYVAGKVVVNDEAEELAVRTESHRQISDPDRWKGDDLERPRRCRVCGFESRNHNAFEDHLTAKDH